MESSNELMQERFELARTRVHELYEATDDDMEIAKEYIPFFRGTAAYMEKLLEAWDWIADGTILAASLEQKKEKIQSLYQDILPINYEKCFGNPAYMVSLYGLEYGRLLSFLYAEMHSQIESVYEQDMEELVIRMELFLEIYQAYVCAWQERDVEQEKNVEQKKEAAQEKSVAEMSYAVPEYEQLRETVYWFISDYSETETAKRIRKSLDAKEDFLTRIVMESNLNDLSYLYSYGEYITENEEKLAAYLNGLPAEKIQKMADTFTEGYRIGFEVGGKDITKKKTVNIRYVAGFERVIRAAILNFQKIGLEPTIYRASLSIFHKRGANRIGFYGAEANKQFIYDHKEDEALYLDKKYIGRKLEELHAAYEEVKELAYVHGGPACMEAFGEIPFSPETKPEANALSPAQQKLSVEYASEAGRLVNQYIKGEERSFTIIAFPVPEIGVQFEEIFDAVIEINTLDYMKYRNIQQTLIDCLDKALTVRVKGCGGNKTDLTVALHPLNNPEKETIFENCVADVNIPVGEVFTSPQLEGTNGVLHVKKVFLEGLEYRNLELHFENGMITDYICSNFESEEENKKYIKDNVLFHHDTLPMGEFAIGTNTTAYAAARKYDIADKLPILIAEKTGPHFAVGDTCYSHSEDLKVYNPDGKEIIARDNSCSMKRLTDMSAAYFNCHTDVTIPYDELGELTAVSGDEEVTIIRDGVFVLPGCEELNKPF